MWGSTVNNGQSNLQSPNNAHAPHERQRSGRALRPPSFLGASSPLVEVAQGPYHPAVKGVVIGHHPEDPPGRPQLAPVGLDLLVKTRLRDSVEIGTQQLLSFVQEGDRRLMSVRDVDCLVLSPFSCGL